MLRVSEQPAPPPPSPADLGRELMAAVQGGRTRYGTVYRMSEEELVKCFSTSKPSRAVVERNSSSVPSLVKRGTGRYAVVFDAANPETPTWLYFGGTSGD
jgi:hypothetical protein